MNLRHLPCRQWPEVFRDEWEERAAIMAEGEGLTREASEEMARARIIEREERNGRAGVG